MRKIFSMFVVYGALLLMFASGAAAGELENKLIAAAKNDKTDDARALLDQGAAINAEDIDYSLQEAVLNCSCQTLVRSETGMKTVYAQVGFGMHGRMSDEFLIKLANEKWAQNQQTKLGYATVGISFLKLTGTKKFFSHGEDSETFDYAISECKKLRDDPTYLGCALTVTFPINDNAKKGLKVRSQH